MERFRRYLSKASCCAILLLPLAYMDVGQAVAAPAATNVNVVNTPLPVSVTNTPIPVPLPVRDVDSPANQPFQAFVQFTMPSGTFSSNSLIAAVPLGKRLVIEHATVIAETESGRMLAQIATTIATEQTPHWLVLTEQGPVGGPPVFLASQPIRVYADPGTAVYGIVSRSNDSTGTGSGAISISGHLVDNP